jgi:hypothetical protein
VYSLNRNGLRLIKVRQQNKFSSVLPTLFPADFQADIPKEGDHWMERDARLMA